MIAWLGASLFGVATIINILVALGLPLGEFTMGGKYKVLPVKLRILCVVSFFVQIIAIITILQVGKILPLLFSMKVTRNICIFFAVYLSLNSIVNVFSNSKKERYVATPLSVAAAICFWISVWKA